MLALSILVFGSLQASAQTPGISLSEEQKKWLTEHPVLRLGVGVAFPPYMWVDKKDDRYVFKGMVSDYVDLLGKRLGVDMQIVFGIPFNEALDRGRTGRIDLFPCLSKTPDRAQFLLFTKPYLSYPLVIITREDAPILGGLEDLKGKRFAVVKHLFVYSKMQNDYSNLDLNYVFTGKVEENLEAVSLGRADACVINLAAASYYIQKKGLTNLRIAASVNWEGVQLAMGVRKDWPILLGIIEKALASISQKEKDRISQRWIRAEYEAGVAVHVIWRWSLWIGLGLAVLFALFFFWNRRLRKEIVEKEKAEMEILQQKQTAERYLNLAGVMFIGLDGDGNVNIANKKACSVLECNEGDIIGKNWFEHFIPQSIRQDVHAVFKQLIEGDVEPVEYYENPIISKNGKEKQIAWQNTYITDHMGNIIGILGSGEDITEKKHLEAQLQHIQKMEAIGTLAGGIAHDFNNILGIILGNTELAMDDVPEWNPAAQNLDEIRKACMRAKDVVQQILSFSRKSVVEQKPLNIGPVVTESLKLLRASIPTSIDIRQHIAEDIDPILGDATQIHQVMMNLCTNAAHSMENEGGIIEVALKNTEIDKNTTPPYPHLDPGRYVHLVVSDTGAGISPEAMARVFDPYFTTKDVGKGTGLGLSVVHGIVNSHHGKIWVESEPGKGSAFNILFPAVEMKDQGEPKVFQALPTGHERILFVDDEEAMVNLNQQRLERLGYKVTGKTDSSEALAFFLGNSDQIDLVITDMTMPHMTGDRLAGEILKIRPGTPIILCTGYSEKISKESAQDLGIRKYIEKPIEMENLARSVREVLDGP